MAFKIARVSGMNKALSQLLEIARKEERLVIGLMSGTSLDGLDIALCKVTNHSVHQLKFRCIDYPVDLRSLLFSIRSKEHVNLSSISKLHTGLAHYFANEIIRALQEWGIERQEIDLIGSHGQTIYHAPDDSPSHTLQIVDGDHIAQLTGIITVSDFRQKHVSAGGEGAPLAVYLDRFLFQDESKFRVALNLGGIANLTIVPPRNSTFKVISTDVGPANTLIDEAMKFHFNRPFDESGKIAKEGSVSSKLVKYLLLDPFFRKSFPKSTGQELFSLNWVHHLMQSHQIELSKEDLVASLTELTIKSIQRSIESLLENVPFELVVSGGGVKNIFLTERLQKSLPQADLKEISEFGISSDAKEAVLMAYLADRIFVKNGLEAGVSEVHLGKISLPN